MYGAHCVCCIWTATLKIICEVIIAEHTPVLSWIKRVGCYWYRQVTLHSCKVWPDCSCSGSSKTIISVCFQIACWVASYFSLWSICWVMNFNYWRRRIPFLTFCSEISVAFYGPVPTDRPNSFLFSVMPRKTWFYFIFSPASSFRGHFIWSVRSTP